MPVTLHRRRRLELVVDRPHLERWLQLLDEWGVRGYTVLPAAGGRGIRGTWSPGRLTDATDRVVVWAVVSKDDEAQLVEALDEALVDLPGVAFLSDVEVLRPERF